MDDFLYATPSAAPEPGSLTLFGIDIVAFGLTGKRILRR
jgi:hypothetical protein